MRSEWLLLLLLLLILRFCRVCFYFFRIFLICSLAQLVFTLTNADKFGKWQTTKCAGEKGEEEEREGMQRGVWQAGD